MDASEMRLLNPIAATRTDKHNPPSGIRSRVENEHRQYDQPECEHNVSESLRKREMAVQQKK